GWLVKWRRQLHFRADANEPWYRYWPDATAERTNCSARRQSTSAVPWGLPANSQRSRAVSRMRFSSGSFGARWAASRSRAALWVSRAASTLRSAASARTRSPASTKDCNSSSAREKASHVARYSFHSSRPVHLLRRLHTAGGSE